MRFVLPRAIGDVEYGVTCDSRSVRAVIARLGESAATSRAKSSDSCASSRRCRGSFFALRSAPDLRGRRRDVARRRGRSRSAAQPGNARFCRLAGTWIALVPKPLKSVLERLEVPRAFDETGLHLAKSIAKRYLCTLGEALSAVVLADAIPRMRDTFVRCGRPDPRRYPSVPPRFIRLIWEDLPDGLALEAALATS